MSDPTCGICGSPMVREVVIGNETHWHCKENRNPNGPTRHLSPELKAQRKHHDQSCKVTRNNGGVR